MAKRHSFWWDEINIEHVAEHGVELYEAEEVIANTPTLNKVKRDRYAVYGQTNGGRYLLVVFALKSGQRIRVITARDMTNDEKKQLRRRRK